MNLRLFVAVELDPAVVEELTRVRAALRSRPGSGSVRWVDAGSAHLTLKFLGDTDERRLPEIERALDEGCRGYGPLELSLSGVGAFPGARKPRVLWVGLAGAADELGRLQGSIDAALARAGFAREERGFSPHLTIGRVRQGASADDYRALEAMLSHPPPVSPATLAVAEVSLMRSILKPAGAEYRRLHAARLQG